MFGRYAERPIHLNLEYHTSNDVILFLQHESELSIANVLNEMRRKMYTQNPFLSATLCTNIQYPCYGFCGNVRITSKHCPLCVPYRKCLIVCVCIWQVAQNLSCGNTKQNDGSENRARLSSQVSCSGVRVRVEAYSTNTHTNVSTFASIELSTFGTHFCIKVFLSFSLALTLIWWL